jgi:hypothetical protein
LLYLVFSIADDLLNVEVTIEQVRIHPAAALIEQITVLIG